MIKNSCCSTGLYPRYTSHCHDILTNLASNIEETRLILNRGLSIDNNTSNIVLRGKYDTTLFESVDNKEMFQNIASLKSIPRRIIF